MKCSGKKAQKQGGKYNSMVGGSSTMQVQNRELWSCRKLRTDTLGRGVEKTHEMEESGNEVGPYDNIFKTI